MSTAELESGAVRSRAWQRHAGIVGGLFWAAALLGLLAFWVGAKYWDDHALIVVLQWALAAVVLVLAAWQTSVLAKLPRSKSEQNDALAPQRMRLAFALFGVSLLMLLAMLHFAWREQLEAFPIVSSGIVLTIAGLVCGAALLFDEGKGLSPKKMLESLITQKIPVAVTLLVIGGVLFLIGVIVLARNRSEMALVLPYSGGLLLLGMVLLGGGLWHLLAMPSDMTVGNLRILILILGGAAGFIISTMTVIAVILWRDSIIGSGVAHWQGPQGWRLWLAIYVKLFGLLLMFGSFYLAHGDIRRNAALRRALYGYNAFFVGYLLLALLVVLNIMVYAGFPYTYEWTKSQGFYSLNDQSKQILDKLEERGEEVTFLVMMSPQSEVQRETVNLLNNMRAYSGVVRIQTQSPDRLTEKDFLAMQEKYPKLKESFHGGTSRGLLVVYGSPDEKKPPHAFIPANDLLGVDTKRDPDTERVVHTRDFKAEGAIMTKLRFLALREQKPIIYFTQSNGEIDASPGRAMRRTSLAAKSMRSFLEKSNYEVRQLFFDFPKQKELPSSGNRYTQAKLDGPHRIPEDAKTVVIAWPKRPFSALAVKALHDYMKRGGKMIILSNNIDERRRPINTGLEGFAAQYGVEMKRDAIVGFVARGGLIMLAQMDRKANNELAKGFASENFFVEAARTVSPKSGASGYSAETIMNVEPRGQFPPWAETELEYLNNLAVRFMNLRRNRETYVRLMVREPRSIAVAVRDRDRKPRMVVYGATDWITDNPTVQAGRGAPPYKALFASSLEWLGERPEFIGIPPKRSGFYTLRAGTHFTRAGLVPLGLLTFAFVGLGIGMWVVRRR